MSQNPNGPDYNNPYGPGPSNPNYPPAPGPGYGAGQPPSGPNPNYANPNYGQPPSGPNPNYGQPPSGPNPNYGQYAFPPSVPGEPAPNSGYGAYTTYPPNPLAPPPPDAGPYDPTVFSSSGATYPPYTPPGYGSTPSNPGYPPISSPPFAPPISLPPTPPAKKSNARTVLISVIALLIVVGGVLGLVLYNNHQTEVHNNDGTATAQVVAQTTGTAQAYASATVNAQATATYIQTHYPFSSNQVLNDPLKDNSQASKWGWDIGTGCAFTNGAYEATESKTNLILPCFGENTNFSNFTFEIQMDIKNGGTSAQGGVIFRANTTSLALYILFLDTQGNYELDSRANSSGNSTRTLKSGTIASFATGFFQVHTIGIVANGSQITVYVDQNQVAKVTDSTFSSGAIGVISDYGSSATTVAYTNAKVWQL